MAYRLYTRLVAHGITDFNDQCVHILDIKTVGDDTIALLFDDECEVFNVGHYLQFKEDMNAIIYTDEQFSGDFREALEIFDGAIEYPLSEKLDFMDDEEDDEELECMDLEDQFEYLLKKGDEDDLEERRTR